ncbi:MAG: hypothetical protein JRH15_02690 [Deltaproteobacteria bacterium]|nr:hypothetical protein [Deltaproteobacteria bacterium]
MQRLANHEWNAYLLQSGRQSLTKDKHFFRSIFNALQDCLMMVAMVMIVIGATLLFGG